MPIIGVIGAIGRAAAQVVSTSARVAARGVGRSSRGRAIEGDSIIARTIDLSDGAKKDIIDDAESKPGNPGQEVLVDQLIKNLNLTLQIKYAVRISEGGFDLIYVDVKSGMKWECDHPEAVEIIMEEGYKRFENWVEAVEIYTRSLNVVGTLNIESWLGSGYTSFSGSRYFNVQNINWQKAITGFDEVDFKILQATQGLFQFFLDGGRGRRRGRFS